ncbi:hypothetical protein HZB02_02710 [Candidatus Woesearchaeota archaeon]|nr:hypothetical protein [Candidatus Woesearchaeota archaeon]
MIRQYPISKPTSALGTGSLFYQYLLQNLMVPAQSTHQIWYAGEATKISQPDKYAFRGNIPISKRLELLTLSGKPLTEAMGEKGVEGVIYTFTGSEGPTLVSDLTASAKTVLAIPAEAKPRDKVYNPNFREYQDLDDLTKLSNELAALSLPKAISSYFGQHGKTNYSEIDVLKFMQVCFTDLSSEQMTHVLNTNHMAWAALAYMRENRELKGATRTIAGDLQTEFYGQNTPDFYSKDLGTILPSMFFALASLGEDPVAYHNRLDIDVWGAKEVAVEMQKCLPTK